MSFGWAKCDRSVVSDLKIMQMPRCSRQGQRGCNTPWTYGKTAVDLNSITGSLLGAVLVPKRGGTSVTNKYR